MGKPRETGKPRDEQRIQHISHEHPLELFNIQQLPPHFAKCSGCKIKPSAMVYGCKPCNYILHVSCSQMPQLIRHPADPNHCLTLLLKPAYPDGKFGCDACGVDGNGFCYHCSTCGLDIHILCATMPLSVTHQIHPHPLNLAFSPPYVDKSFVCDICRNPGSNHWVYRCNGCGFDAHLNCATSKARPVPSVHQHQTRSPLPLPQYNSFPAANHQYLQPTGIVPYVHQHQTRSPLPQPQYSSFPAANHQYLQPTSIAAASQNASQNFLQGFIDQQQVDVQQQSRDNILQSI